MSKRHKALYWLFKLLSVVVSCAFPIWAIYEKFPVWTYTYGTYRSVGVGGIFIIILLLFILRKPVFKFMEDRLRLKYAPPILTPMVMIAITSILIYINDFIVDLHKVSWMWLIGCAIGTVLTFIAENCYGKKEEKKDE